MIQYIFSLCYEFQSKHIIYLEMKLKIKRDMEHLGGSFS